MLVSARAVLPSATHLSLAITMSIQNHPPTPAGPDTDGGPPRSQTQTQAWSCPVADGLGAWVWVTVPGVLLGGRCLWSMQESW